MDKKKGKLKWIMLHHTRLRRGMGILLAFAMVLGTLPISGIAVSASENREAGLCQHHGEHTPDCGYSEEDNTPCGYECHICPIEDLIAALPDEVTEDNADKVRAQLDEILALYRELAGEEQEQIDRSRCLELQEALDAANDPGPAEGSVNYQEASWDGSKVTYTGQSASCTPVESSAEAVAWNTGWYVVNSNATIDQPITVSGDVNLILSDGCTLTAEKGIVVPKGTSLTIYAQANGSGTLTATGTFDDNGANASAGIGGSTTSFDSGEITIHGGIINATGGGSGSYGGAGIGGGTQRNGNGGSGSTITIYGGTITAGSGVGDITGAGIGGGGSRDTAGGSGSTITIYGGSVTAVSTGGNNGTGGAGIGGGGGIQDGGDGDKIWIWGGTVHAIGGNRGAGIGGGGGSSSLGVSHRSGDGTNITISGGKVTAVGGQYAAGIGGGGGYYYYFDYGHSSTDVVGGTGSISITGGIVDAEGGAGNSGGEYQGDPIGNGGHAGGEPSVMIAEGYAVYQDGTPVNKGTKVTGAVTVKQCGHEGCEMKDLGSGKHELTCPCCGYSCSHDTTLSATAGSNHVITVREACDTCGYGKDLGTVTIHVPDLVYGDLTGKISAETTLETLASVSVGVNGGGTKAVFTAPGQSTPQTMADLTGNALLRAGQEHNLKVFIAEGASTALKSAECQLAFKVAPAPLTADMVTLDKTEFTYNGAGQKPTPTVRHGETTLKEGTDYEASYTRDGAVTDDFTNVGTVTVTITGKGNYTGPVTKEFTIGKAPGRTIPDLTGSYTDNGETYIYTITPINGAVYRMGDSGKWSAPGETAGNVFAGIKPGARVAFYAKMPETENYKEGAAQGITVDFPKLTPAAPALSYNRKTDGAAGKITLTITEVTGAEYSFDGGAVWQDAREQGGFDASQTVTLAIRLKETDTHNPSPAQTVTVDLAKKDRKVPPAFTLSVEANGETDYTVAIPRTEGCEYSFDSETWSAGNVKTGVKVGETVTGYKRYKETDEYNASGTVSDAATMPKFTVKTPVISPAGGSYSGSISVTITCGSPDAEIYYTTDGSTPGRGSTRYTGAFTVSAPATVKAVARKDGLHDSAAATVSYTKQGGGSSSGSGSGSSGGSTSGNSGSTGSGTNPASKQPFIKDRSGREGWDVIRAEAETAAAAPAGGTVVVDMNGAVSVPGSIFAAVRGKDVTLRFDMGSGITWSVNGKDIAADTGSDTDFSVKTDAGAIPKELIAETAGGLAHLELSLAHEGAFGFTAMLTLRIVSRDGNGITAGSSGTAARYTGMYANLFYYNPDLRSLEFICAGQIGEDGTADLPFVHASDYTVILSAGPMGPAGTPENPQEPEETEKPREPAEQAGVKSVKLAKTVYTYNGKAKKPSVIAVDTEGRKISGRYYTVSYKNNKKAGKATATVKFTGGYSGIVKKTFTIRPAGTSIRKLTAASGGFTVKWKKKTAQTSGYQIQYSTNAEFKGNTRSAFVRKNSKAQKTVKGLKAGKKYYVRIRTYKTVKADGKHTRIYSTWSRSGRVNEL